MDVGLGLLLTFMGGAIASIVYIKDEKGYTHFSGKGKLGSSGRFPLVPALVFSAMYVFVSLKSEESSISPLMMGAFGCIGFAWGAFCEILGGSSLSVKKD